MNFCNAEFTNDQMNVYLCDGLMASYANRGAMNPAVTAVDPHLKNNFIEQILN